MARPPIAVGGLVNVGGGIGGGGNGGGTRCRHGHLLADCDKCTAAGGGTGVKIPVIVGKGAKDSDKVTSVRATFKIAESIDIEKSYLAFEIKVGVDKDGKIILQPILIPTTVLQRDNAPPVPPVKVKKVTTAVRIEEGQTVLIGGLIEDEDKDIKKRVPILGNIPLLGRLFKSKDSKVTKRNLIIFVTPHIIPGD
jgi:type II secretory pathway component HofQ